MDYKRNSKIIIIIIIVALLSLGIGISYGVQKTMHLGIQMVFALMDKKVIEIDIDRDVLEKGIMQYKNNIGSCLFLNNETL